MIVKYNNNKYRTRFYKDSHYKLFFDIKTKFNPNTGAVDFHRQQNERMVFITTAVLEILNAETDEWIVLFDATSTQSPQDVYSKRVGKKHALARVLKKAGIPKEGRKQFWKRFEKEMGGWV